MSGRHGKIDLTFARRLEQILMARKIYPSQLARMTGLSRSSIYGYIDGTIQPKAYVIIRIAQALNVSADWLLGLEKNTSDKLDKK